MLVVLDANLVVAIATYDERAPAVSLLLQRWLDAADELHAPALLPYEVASALTSLAAANMLSGESLATAWRAACSLPITLNELDLSSARVIDIALQLRRHSAYDAAYLALAEQLGAELWTLDGPLYRNAVGLGFPVHLVATGPS